MHVIQNILLLLLSISSVQSHTTKKLVNGTSEDYDSHGDPDYFSVSAIIERANKNIGNSSGEITITDGDIAVPTGLQNADRCTFRQCKWRRNRQKKVYVPYVISRQFSSSERNVIMRGLMSFHRSTCIRFVRRTNQEDYINIISHYGCYSFIGRRGGRQVVSLQRNGCVYHHIVQHEILHALGFHHEQNRSDRDRHVRIVFRNVTPGQQHNFKKVRTNNLRTPYDYNSVMHYSSTAFSRNGQPTIIPIPNRNVSIGRATKMSRNDILRIKRLYCR